MASYNDLLIAIPNELLYDAMNKVNTFMTRVASDFALTVSQVEAYTDAVAQGLTPKTSCRVTTTGGNITLSGIQTIDGILLSVGDRVLVKDQTDQSTNGIWVVSASAWTRSVDANISSEVSPGMFTFVVDGLTNYDKGFSLITKSPIVLGTTSLVFTQVTGAGSVVASSGLLQTGNIIYIDPAILTEITSAQSAISNIMTLLSGKQPSILQGLHSAMPAAGNVNSLYITTDTNTIYRDSGTKWVAVGSAGGSAQLTLLHTNITETTSSTTMDLLFDGVLIPDYTRHTSQINIATASTGNGQIQVQITDGTTTVTQNMAVVSSTGRFHDSATVDCSALLDVASGAQWYISIYALSSDGTDYSILKFMMLGNPVDFMSGQTLILSNPATTVSSGTLTTLDTKYFPVNYAIDNSCQTRFLVNATLGTGVTSAEIHCRLTTTNGVSVSTNEVVLTATASGIVQGYVDFPSIVAPTVRVDVLGRVNGGSGVVTLGHWEAWMEG